MKKSKFTETQIVSILKQADAGVPIKDICRQAGISVPMSRAAYYCPPLDWTVRDAELIAALARLVAWARRRH
jgi:hypothetical protein